MNYRSTFMSHVAMKTSDDDTVAPAKRDVPAGRALALITAVCLGLSACETMKDTMESINIFKDDQNSTTAAAASETSGGAGDPRRGAMVEAGIEPVPADYASSYMDQQEQLLKERLEGTGVAVTRAGDIIILSMPGSKTFSSGSSNVDAQFYPVLDSVVGVLDEFDQTYVDIIGHTDSKGSREYNQRLSEKRAKSVAKYLQLRALKTQRLLSDGMGEDDPIASNDTSEGRAMNRRVEIKLKPVT
ncbi:MAG: OmpA family protein [Gammaproteobacteria bacterium]|nr:OmpA family protein [Gammaproteobacteria bacterium]